MATVAELTAIITADTSGFDAGVDSANQKLQELGKTGGQAGFDAEKGLNSIGKAGLAVGAALLAPIVGVTKMAGDFEYAMDAVNAALGGVDTETMQQLSDQAMDLGASSKYSAEEVAGVQEQLAKSGLTAQEVLGGSTKAVLDLAAATGEELAPSTDIVTSAMHSFGLEAEDTSRIADIFTVGMNKSSGSLQDMQRGLNYIGPSLAAMDHYTEMTTQGLDGQQEALKDSVALLALFNQRGLKFANVGVSMARMFDNLADPTSDGAQAMERYGIEAFDAEGKMKPIPDLLDAIGAGLDGLSDKDRITAIGDIFGEQAKDVVDQMVRAFDEGGLGDDFRDITKAMNEEGLAAKQAAIRQDNLNSAVEMLGGSLKNLGYVMGEPLQDPLKNLTKGITKATDALANAPEPIRKMITGFGALAGGLLTAGGGAAYGASKIIGLANTLTNAGVPVAKLATGLGILGVALGAGLLAYETNFMGFGDFVDDSMEKAGQAVEKFGDLFDEAFFENRNAEMSDLAAGIAAVGYAADGAFGTNIGKWTRNLANGIDVLQDSFARGAAMGVDPWVNALESAAEASRAMGNEELARQLNLGSKAWQAMTDKMTETEGQMDQTHRELSALQEAAGVLLGPEGLGAVENNEDVPNFFDDLGSNIGTARDELGKLKDTLQAHDWGAAWNQLTDSGGTSRIDSLKGIAEGFGNIHEEIDRSEKNIDEWFDNFGTNLSQVDPIGGLQNISDGFKDWISDTSDMLLGTMDQLSGSGDIVKGSDGLIEQLGNNIGQSFAELPQKIEAALPDGNPFDAVGDWLKDSWEGATKQFSGPSASDSAMYGSGGGGGGADGGSMFGGMIQGIGDNLGQLGGMVQGILPDENPFQGVGDWLDNSWKEITAPYGSGGSGSQAHGADAAGAVDDVLAPGSQFNNMLGDLADGFTSGIEGLGAAVTAALPKTNPFQGVGDKMQEWLGPLGSLLFPSASAAELEKDGKAENIFGDPKVMGAKLGADIAETFASDDFITGMENGMKEMDLKVFDQVGGALLSNVSEGMKNAFNQPIPKSQGGSGELGGETFGQQMISSIGEGLTTALQAEDAADLLIPAVNAFGGAFNTTFGKAMVDTLVPKGQTGLVGEKAAGGIGGKMIQSLADGLTTSLSEEGMAEKFIPAVNALGSVMNQAMLDSTKQGIEQAGDPAQPGQEQTTGFGQQMVQGLASGLANGITNAEPALFQPVTNALGTQLGAAMLLEPQQTQAPGGVGPAGPAVDAFGQTMVEGLTAGLANGISSADPTLFVPVSNALGTQLGAAMSLASQQVQPPGGVGPVAPDQTAMGQTLVEGLATGLTDSITNADPALFTPVGGALGTQLGTALQTAMQGTQTAGGVGPGGQPTTDVGAGIGTQMVQGLATGMADAVGAAPAETWTPVGQAIGTQLSTALQTAVDSGASDSAMYGSGGGGGIGAQLGESVGQMITTGVEQADWAPVGQSMSTKLGETLQTVATDGDMSTQLGDSVGQMMSQGVADANFDNVGESLKTQMTSQMDSMISDLSSSVSQQMEQITQSIEQAVQGIGEAIKGVVDDVKSTIDDMSSAISDATNEVSSAVQDMQTAVSDAASAMSDAASQASEAASEIGTAASEAAEAVSQAMQQMAAAVQAAAGAIASAAGQIVGSLNEIAAAAQAAGAAVGAVGGMSGGGGSAPSGTGFVSGRSAEVGEAMVQGTAKGMETAAPMVARSSELVADTAYDAMADAVQMGSPAERFVPVGRSITQGMMKGMMAEAKSRLKSAIGQMAGQVASAMGKIKSAMAQGIGQVQSRIKEAMGRAQGEAASGGQAAGAAAAKGSAAGVDAASGENERAVQRMWKKALKKLLEGKDEMRFLGEEFAREFWLGMLDKAGSLEFAKFVTDMAVEAAENAIEAIKAKMQGLAVQFEIATNAVDKLQDELDDINKQLASMDAADAEAAAAAAAQARIDAAQELLDKQKAITAELEKQFSTEFQEAHQAHIRAAKAGGQGPAQAEFQAKLAKAEQTNALIAQSKAMEEHLAKELEMIRKAIEAESKAREAAAKAAARADLEARKAALEAELEAAKKAAAEVAAAQHAAQVEYTQTVMAESEKRIRQLQKEKQHADSPEEKANAKAGIELEKQKIELANKLAEALERQANAKSPEALAEANAQIQYYTEALAGLDEVDVTELLQELVSTMSEVSTSMSSAATSMGDAAASMSSMSAPATEAASSMGKVGSATGTLAQQIDQATGGMFSMGAKYKEVTDKMAADGYAFQAQFQAMTQQVRGTAETEGTAIGTALSTGITDKISQGGAALRDTMVQGLQTGVDAAEGVASKGGTSIASAFGQEMHNELGVKFPELQTQIREGLQKPIDDGVKAAETGGKDIGQGLFQEAKTGVDQKADPFKRTCFQALDTPIRNGIRDANKGGTDIGHALGDGMKQGVQDRAHDIAEQAARTVREAIDRANQEARTGSPSKETRDLGRDLGDGLILGMRDRESRVEQGAEDMVYIPRNKHFEADTYGKRGAKRASAGPIIHVENLNLPGVRDADQFMREIENMVRTNGVSSGR